MMTIKVWRALRSNQIKNAIANEDAYHKTTQISLLNGNSLFCWNVRLFDILRGSVET